MWTLYICKCASSVDPCSSSPVILQLFYHQTKYMWLLHVQRTSANVMSFFQSADGALSGEVSSSQIIFANKNICIYLLLLCFLNLLSVMNYLLKH